MELALRVNGLLASPGFDAWLAGDALDVQKLLYTDARQAAHRRSSRSRT